MTIRLDQDSLDYIRYLNDRQKQLQMELVAMEDAIERHIERKYDIDLKENWTLDLDTGELIPPPPVPTPEAPVDHRHDG